MIARLTLVALLVASPLAGAVQPESAPWRARVDAIVAVGWAHHADAYRRVMEQMPAEDRLGGLVFPDLEAAERQGIDTLPLLYQLLFGEDLPQRAMEPLGRRLLALARAEPQRVDAALLADTLGPKGVEGPVRGVLARALAALPAVEAVALGRLSALLRAEARRAVPSRAVTLALLEGFCRGARDADGGGARIRELQQMAGVLDLSNAELTRAIGGIGGPAAEGVVLAAYRTARRPEDRRWAIGALGRVGTPLALEAVLQEAGSTDGSAVARRAAIRALGRFAPSEQMLDLVEGIARDEGRPPGDRGAAIEAFRELVRSLTPGEPRKRGAEGRLRHLEGVVPRG